MKRSKSDFFIGLVVGLAMWFLFFLVVGFIQSQIDAQNAQMMKVDPKVMVK